MDVGFTRVTFRQRRTALPELENDAVGAHRLLLVAAEKLLHAAEVSFGSTQVELPGGRPDYQAVLVVYRITNLEIEKGTQTLEMLFSKKNLLKNKK